MNENINLYELLKGHEGELFYSPAFGNTKFLGIDNSDEEFPLVLEDYPNNIYLTKEGKYNIEGECVLFPSKDQRDWNKWAEEPKIPKTWSDVIKSNSIGDIRILVPDNKVYDDYPIAKSALALLKIHQLIEAGYGGNVTKEEWDNRDSAKYICNCIGGRINTGASICTYYHIAFHTKQLREEFLSYPENVQLVKDFYMI